MKKTCLEFSLLINLIENSNFAKVIDELERSFGAGVVPIQVPIGAEEQFSGIIDALNQKHTLIKMVSLQK